jgi:hypothetical protein
MSTCQGRDKRARNVHLCAYEEQPGYREEILRERVDEDDLQKLRI